MTQVVAQPAGVIIIDGEPFFLGKDQDGRPLWRAQMVQTQEGDPRVPRRKRFHDWSRGMGDSRGVFRGAVEYAENAYLAMGRILPGPKVSTIQTNNDATVKDMCEVTVPADRILCGGGTKVVEVDPSDHTVASTATLTGDVLSVQPWKGDQVAVATGDSVDYYVRDNTGSYAQNSISKKARCFGLANGSLVKGYQDTWARCDAENISGVDNWGTEYAIGDPSGLVRQVFGHNRWDYVLKDEGLYTFDDETSKESNTLTDLEAFKSAENRYVYRWYNHLYVCSLAGLYRYIQQGAARPVGPEVWNLNEGELADVYPTAGAAFGAWNYTAFYKKSSDKTYITMSRRAREGDHAEGSDITIVSVIYTFTGECRCMLISELSGNPRLYFAEDTDVSHFQLTRDGAPAEFRDSGSVTVWLSPTDLDSPMTTKQFRSVEVIGRNASANRTIQVKCKRDGGSAENVGSALTSLASTFGEAFWTRGTNDEARVLQLGIVLGVDSTSVAPEVRDLIVNYEDRPEMVQGAVVGLRLRDFDQAGEVVSQQTAQELKALLEGHMDGPVVQVTDPWGTTYPARLSQLEGDVTYQYFGSAPQLDMAVSIRRLEYS